MDPGQECGREAGSERSESSVLRRTDLERKMQKELIPLPQPVNSHTDTTTRGKTNLSPPNTEVSTPNQTDTDNNYLIVRMRSGRVLETPDRL